MARIDHYRRVVAFGAHPDDLEVGCGGTLARVARAGGQVTMVIASIPDRFEIRMAEAQAGAATLGAELLVIEHERARRLEDIQMHELVARFDRVVAERDPDLVITLGAREQHWDHALVNRAATCAVRRSRCDLITFATSPALDPMGQPVGRCHADITQTIDAKLAAIAAHVSQGFTPERVEGRRDIARAIGQQYGVRYAEAFEVARIAL